MSDDAIMRHVLVDSKKGINKAGYNLNHIVTRQNLEFQKMKPRGNILFIDVKIRNSLNDIVLLCSTRHSI